MRVPDPVMLKFFRLGNENLDELAALEDLCFTLPWSRKQLAEALALPRFAAFGLRAPQHEAPQADACARLAAYISLYHNTDELEILNLAVRPELRGRGCGARLLRLVLDMAAKTGIRRIVLEARSGNIPALALYKRQGFVQVGRRRGYYSDNGEDALVLELLLERISK